MQKEKNKSLKQVIQTEEYNIKAKRDEINDLQKKLTQLRASRRICKIKQTKWQEKLTSIFSLSNREANTT